MRAAQGSQGAAASKQLLPPQLQQVGGVAGVGGQGAGAKAHWKRMAKRLTIRQTISPLQQVRREAGVVGHGAGAEAEGVAAAVLGGNKQGDCDDAARGVGCLDRAGCRSRGEECVTKAVCRSAPKEWSSWAACAFPCSCCLEGRGREQSSRSRAATRRPAQPWLALGHSPARWVPSPGRSPQGLRLPAGHTAPPAPTTPGPGGREGGRGGAYL